MIVNYFFSYNAPINLTLGLCAAIISTARSLLLISGSSMVF